MYLLAVALGDKEQSHARHKDKQQTEYIKACALENIGEVGHKYNDTKPCFQLKGGHLLQHHGGKHKFQQLVRGDKQDKYYGGEGEGKSVFRPKAFIGTPVGNKLSERVGGYVVAEKYKGHKQGHKQDRSCRHYKGHLSAVQFQLSNGIFVAEGGYGVASRGK